MKPVKRPGKRPFTTARVDDQGRITLPPELGLGLEPGALVRVRQDGNGVRIGRSTASLAKLYVELTTECNIGCTTCMRNAWEEPGGRMGAETWKLVLAGGKGMRPAPALFIGGYGEPLCHPDALDMMADAKRAGLSVEMITNATLLDENAATRLVELGLDRLWVSLDSGGESEYAGVRRGGSLSRVVENVSRLVAARERALSETPLIGISFVAMRDTIHSLPEVLRLGRRLGADRFLVSNLLPHTQSMLGQALYQRSHYEPDLPASERTPLLDLPRMEINDVTQLPLAEALKDSFTVSIAGQRLSLGSCTCPFVDQGSMAVRWDGSAHPCPPLMHPHTSYLADRERKVGAFAVGSLASQGLGEIWNDPSYVELRERLLAFDFAPCTTCNGCEEAGANAGDCFGNAAPACGGCLWAQGFIRCP